MEQMPEIRFTKILEINELESDQFRVNGVETKIRIEQAHCKTGYAENPIDQRTGCGNGNVGRLPMEMRKVASKGTF